MTAASCWILFSDLDGTILDGETYEPGPALDGLAKCKKARLPVILCSSKTRAEIELYHKTLAPHPACPFITENGGGIFFPKDYWEEPQGAELLGDFWKITLGTAHNKVLPALKDVARAIGININNFSDMLPKDVAHMTGLSVEQAKLAMEREFDEPFWIEKKDHGCLDLIEKEIQQRGMRFTRGGRCLHIHGASDKGLSAQYVRQRYEQACGKVCAAAVGDAANDLPLFQAVDKAFLVKKPDGSHDSKIPKINSIQFLSGEGPSGFLQTVEFLLQHHISEQGSWRRMFPPKSK